MVITSIEDVNQYLIDIEKERYRNQDHGLIQLKPYTPDESISLTSYALNILSDMINMIAHRRLFGANDEWLEFMLSIVVITPDNGLATFRLTRTVTNMYSGGKISIRRFIKLKSDNVIQTVLTHYSS